jgi:hypothetical protein
MVSNMANPMSNDLQQEEEGRREAVHNGRLWFEFSATVIAWFSLGVTDVVITWLACVHDEQYGGPSSHPNARVLYFVMWAILFGLASMAGTMSYRSWRTLSGTSDVLRAEGRERKEFMSQAGLFISVTLGMGFIWLCIPLFIMQMCARAR